MGSDPKGGKYAAETWSKEAGGDLWVKLKLDVSSYNQDTAEKQNS